jgi:hypothetical protein
LHRQSLEYQYDILEDSRRVLYILLGIGHITRPNLMNDGTTVTTATLAQYVYSRTGPSAVRGMLTTHTSPFWSIKISPRTLLKRTVRCRGEFQYYVYHDFRGYFDIKATFHDAAMDHYGREMFVQQADFACTIMYHHTIRFACH